MSAPAEACAKSRTRWKHLAAGLVLGGMAGAVLCELNFNVLLGYFQHLIVLTILIGGIVGITRWRRALWIIDGLLLALLLIVAYTPLAGTLLRSVGKADEIQPADGIVILGSGFTPEGVISARAEDRVIYALELMRQGDAPRLILTSPSLQGVTLAALVRDQMRRLGEDYPTEDVGWVQNTHDEAIAVANLVRQSGWHRVIVVTHRWHMRRAAALFAKLNVPVICAPCPDSSFDESTPNPSDRIAAFGVWLHEEVGWVAYKARGWI